MHFYGKDPATSCWPASLSSTSCYYKGARYKSRRTCCMSDMQCMPSRCSELLWCKAKNMYIRIGTNKVGTILLIMARLTIVDIVGPYLIRTIVILAIVVADCTKISS